MQVKEVLQKTTKFFRDKGFDSPRLETELLIASALGWERMKLYLNYEYPMTESELGACRDLVRRRASGEPSAYILGRKGFYNHTFKVNPAVLIPRPETEMLVEQASEWAKRESPAARVVDLGTGSGCIGLSVLAEVSGGRLCAVDISEAAISVARENAEALGLSSRATFICADADTLSEDVIVEVLGGRADLVVANPPYIAEDDPEVQEDVRKFEPKQALFAPDRGLGRIVAWAKTAATVARPGAFVMFEIGHEQGSQAQDIFSSTQMFRDVEIVRDHADRERFIRCFRIEED
jgi:release factor glutamine methyltransferase